MTIPWHAGVYNTLNNAYKYISNTKNISNLIGNVTKHAYGAATSFSNELSRLFWGPMKTSPKSGTKLPGKTPQQYKDWTASMLNPSVINYSNIKSDIKSESSPYGPITIHEPKVAQNAWPEPKYTAGAEIFKATPAVNKRIGDIKDRRLTPKKNYLTEQITIHEKPFKEQQKPKAKPKFTLPDWV